MNDVVNNWFQLLAFCHVLFLCSAMKENKKTKELKLRLYNIHFEYHCKNTRRRRMSNVTTTLCLRLHQWKTRSTHRKKISLYTRALFIAYETRFTNY